MTKTRDLSDFLIEGGADLPIENAHIIPGVLYPSYVASGTSNKLLDGTTNHSGAFGTAQSDGRKYYYTNIAGSKPIKDPRIGAHFGSQRHKVRSIQLLEQETATNGKDVYSVDGREWFRAVGPDWIRANGSYGHYIYIPTSATTGADFVEIVGYFNAINMSGYSGTARDITLAIDGTANSSNFTGLTTSQNSPISGSRYLSAGSVVNLTFDSTPSLGIHTVKIGNVNGDYLGAFYDIEFIVQDTGSTARKSQINIPAQNVVSFGKKFSVGSDTLTNAVHKHYNPFAQSQTGADVTINSSTTNTAKLADGWSGTGATYYSSELDTATSLGLSAWESGGDFYRPVNGGRVVWWVNSSGDLKCSVNMMPPAGTAIGGVTNGHNVPTGTHNWATKYQPALHSTTIDNSQSEVAKTFHHREFGNGAANGGTGGTYADASMLNGQDNIAYVMDDGLTSLYANNVYNNGSERESIRWWNSANTDVWYITFIGTGFTFEGNANMTRNVDHHTHLCQNLPYGTHIIEVKRTGAQIGTLKVDGVLLHTTVNNTDDELSGIRECSIHQPKRPPIPEDACVIADYMLMADLVKQTAATVGHISKGTRFLSSSRDFFYSAAGSWTGEFAHPAQGTGGMDVNRDADDSTAKVELPFFGTNFISEGYQGRFVSKLNGSALSNVSELSGGWVSKKVGDGTTLGFHKASVNPETNNLLFFASMAIATPIHTAHHYQSFETPYLHELIGGDRNMEQTNLVVSPDGKTWDEVTRDTSYMSPGGYSLGSEIAHATNHTGYVVFNMSRGGIDGVTRENSEGGDGSSNKYKAFYTKDFAIGYDRLICLRDGLYHVTMGSHTANAHVYLYVNNLMVESWHYGSNTTATSAGGTASVYLKRGDYIQRKGGYEGNNDNRWSKMTCTRIN